MKTYDLAIVGYGPTGMTLAALMGQQGHHVVVLDRYQGLYNLPRAACFDDEIMRMFQKLRLADEVLPGTVVQTAYNWVNAAGETLVEMTYDNPGKEGWAALYMMYQPHIEAVLDRRCRSLPTVEVRQGMAVDGLVVTGGEVELAATDTGGNRVLVRSRYVVGADGGAGFVRPALAVGFSDYRFQENWLVCDFRKRRELASVPAFQQVCDPVQPVSIVQIGPDHHRFSFMLDPDESVVSATDERRVWERVASYLGPDDADLVRVANYTFRSRIADSWRQGPVLLAGDAAHEMPPFLAQGMCSGMRDSHNLAWKLDLVLTGRAEPRILDSYQAEREPHVRFITEKAIELGRVQTLRDPAAARLRDERLLAQRRARESPEKIRYPGLTAGLIAAGAPHAGALFIQGRVRSADGTERLFDDLAGAGPCIVVRRPATLAAVTAEQVERWETLGGRVVRLRTAAEPANAGAASAPVTELLDIDGVYDAWFRARDCAAAVVRPDWYLYGTAADAAGLSALLRDMEGALVMKSETHYA
ncbi:MAG TPA: bifunctional 3-(3-hydroxy-phenyl)propionate/3-hydroxycinnamic acid hydroxylase [Trebonia sp.]